MKLNNLILIIFAIGIFSFSSCSKDDDGNLVFQKLTAKVSGQEWTASPVLLTAFKINDKYITIAGANAQKEAMNLNIQGTTEGTYKLNTLAGQTQQICSFKNAKGLYLCTVGEIVVSSIADKRIKGTFRFKAINTKNLKDTINIKDGIFDVNLLNEKTEEPSGN